MRRERLDLAAWLTGAFSWWVSLRPDALQKPAPCPQVRDRQRLGRVGHRRQRLGARATPAPACCFPRRPGAGEDAREGLRITLHAHHPGETGSLVKRPSRPEVSSSSPSSWIVCIGRQKAQLELPAARAEDGSREARCAPPSPEWPRPVGQQGHLGPESDRPATHLAGSPLVASTTACPASHSGSRRSRSPCCLKGSRGIQHWGYRARLQPLRYSKQAAQPAVPAAHLLESNGMLLTPQTAPTAPGVLLLHLGEGCETGRIAHQVNRRRPPSRPDTESPKGLPHDPR